MPLRSARRVLIPGGHSVAARIARIVVTGKVLGTPDDPADHFGFVAEAIGMMKVAGVKLMVADHLAFATAADVRVRLVN